MKRVKRLLAACLALAALLPLGAQELSQQQQDLLQLQKFAQIYRYLTNAYVDEVDTAPVIEGPSRACSNDSTPTRPISRPRR